MRFIAIAVIVCVIIGLFIILFSKELNALVLNLLIKLWAGKTNQNNASPLAAATSTPTSAAKPTNTSTQNFVPPGFIGPSGPPHVNGPSGPPPNY